MQSGSSIIILKGIINISFPQSLVAIGTLQDFSEFVLEFFLDFTHIPLFFNNSHVGWSTGTLGIIFKLDTLRMIVAKLGSIWPGIFRGADL
jgi:hypothetical protein